MNLRRHSVWIVCCLTLLVLLLSRWGDVRCALMTNRVSMALSPYLLQHETNLAGKAFPQAQGWLDARAHDALDQEAARKLGYVAWLQDDIDAALDVWNTAGIDVAAMFTIWGRYEENAGYLQQSLVWYQRALALDTEDADRWNEYAMVLRAEGDNEAALIAFENAYKLGSYDKVLIYGRDLNITERFSESQEVLSQSLQSVPDHDDRLDWWHELIIAQSNNNSQEEVLESVTQALQEFPTDARLLTSYAGLIDSLHGDKQKAQEILEYAISVDPTYSRTYVSLGDLMMEADEYAKAGACYGEAVALRPDHAYWRILQANAIVDSGDLEQAASLYAHAASDFPDNFLIQYNLAWICYQLQDVPCAVHSIEAALFLRDGYIPPEWLYRAGLISELNSDTAQAVTYYQQALNVDEDYEPALDALNQLNDE